MERLEPRLVLDGTLVGLVDDSFDVHQNSLPNELDVLANDVFEMDYEGERRITSVSYGSEGGSVQIGDEGQSLQYAPPADFFGEETFLYVVDGVHSAEVRTSIQPALTFDEYEILPDGAERRLEVMANDKFCRVTTGRGRSLRSV